MFHLLFCLIGVADDLGSLIEHWEPLERSRAPAPCSRHASGHGRALPSTQESSLLWRAGGMRRRYACAVAPQESPSASVWRSAPERRTRSFRVHARAAAAAGGTRKAQFGPSILAARMGSRTIGCQAGSSRRTSSRT